MLKKTLEKQIIYGRDGFEIMLLLFKPNHTAFQNKW